MIIKEICASLPSRVVTNDDIVELILQNSKSYDGNLEQDVKFIKKLIQVSGSNTRHWRADGETAIEHVKKCVDQVLEKSSIKPQDVDLLIYVGVGRGFIEPANAYLMADALQCHNAECFDIIDACMSWIRGLQLANSLFQTSGYKNALIINAEFNKSIFSKSFNLKHRQQLPYTLPSFTMGEAATASLLLPEEDNNFTFKFLSRPDKANLCTTAVYDDYAQFCNMDSKISTNGFHTITSYGKELHKIGEKEIIEVIKQFYSEYDTSSIDNFFVHASSKHEWDRFAQKTNFAHKIYHIYPRTGNLVSASMPTALYLAQQDKQLMVGNKVFLWAGSAGMSFNITRFTF